MYGVRDESLGDEAGAEQDSLLFSLLSPLLFSLPVCFIILLHFSYKLHAFSPCFSSRILLLSSHTAGLELLPGQLITHKKALTESSSSQHAVPMWPH